MDAEQILVRVTDRVMEITLNRPDRLNAWTPQMGNELIAALDAADDDDVVRAVIVTGAGRGFCAGADLAGGGDTFDWRRRADAGTGVGDDAVPRDGGGRLTLRIFECRRPVIAAVNRPAVGVGATITLPMDIVWRPPRRASASSSPAGGSCPRRRRAGFRPVRWGSAGRWNGWRPGACSAPSRADSRTMFSRGQSADAREGVTAFLEKRPAGFPDRISDGLPELRPGWRAPEFG